MRQPEPVEGATMFPEAAGGLREELMVREDRWQEIRRLREQERLSVSEIGRRLDLDRKTVRRCLRDEKWEPYRRALHRGGRGGVVSHRPLDVLTKEADSFRIRSGPPGHGRQAKRA